MEPDSVLSSLYSTFHGRGMDLNLSLDSLEDLDSDSLSEERIYQSELQNRICNTDEMVLQTTERAGDGDTKIGDVDMSDTSQQEERTTQSDNRSQDTQPTYSELRYDPNWRRHQSLLNTSPQDEEDLSDVSSGFSDQLSPEELISDTSGERDHINGNQKAKKSPATAKGAHSKHVRSRRGGGHQNVAITDQAANSAQEAARKDFIERNRATLGVRTQKTHSYLHIHKQKAEESKSDQGGGKSDVVQTKSVSHQEMKCDASIMPESIGETGFPSGLVKQMVSNTTNMANPSSDIDVSVQDNLRFLNECPIGTSYPDRRVYPPGASKDTYVSPEGPGQMVLFHHQIKPQKLKHGQQIIKKFETAGDTLDNYTHSGFSQIDVQEPSVCSAVTCNTDNYIFMPNHIIQLKSAPCEAYARSYSDLQAVTGTALYETRKGEDTHPGANQQQLIKNNQMEEKHQKKLISFLKQEVKLGGIGPTYTMSQEKKEQLRQQREYAKMIQERNRNIPMKARETEVVRNDQNKGKRQKSLEYAKNLPRPQPSPKASGETRVKERRAMSYDSLFPQIKLLEDLQIRHEKEKVAVAALSALHIK
ncbi:jhy protein homolog [Mixophyes fleayi]|uniref:jhy protein homolog n=1 Tax=Mixophyes fleayi TaxID=3061075 RepID=UPI003F4DFE9B